ncbi:type II toxin-antitoxin system PemK/MazF family toxin [bacterium]|nr:type II toxin-antitoxin system PemK/MazF family toxin [bacterium]
MSPFSRIPLHDPAAYEQGGKRPALILSVNPFNRGTADLVVVLPLTTRAKYIRSHVAVTPPEGGLSDLSFIKCEDIRSISRARLTERIGQVAPETLRSIETSVRSITEEIIPRRPVYGRLSFWWVPLA